MTPSLERRLRQMRSRVLVRSWGFRQRRHARGVWFLLRRALADADEVYSIPVEEGRILIAEGFPAEPAGRALEPAKVIVRVPAARLARVSGARPMAVRLSAELLAAEALALVPFDTGDAIFGRTMTIATSARPVPLPDAVRRLVGRLGAEPSVRRVILFGSRARGDAEPRSDVDLAVDAPGLPTRDWLRLAHLSEEADTLLKVDLVRLDEAPAELRARIESEGRTLHER